MGSVKRALGRIIAPILRELSIESSVEVTEKFRWLVLRGLNDARCEPGDKVQVMLDGDFRTYTPFACDADRMSLLVYSHGDGPGAAWGRRARAGDVVRVFG